MTAAQRLLPGAFTARLGWGVFLRADALVTLTPWEARLMREMFDAPESKIHVVPNGVEEVFLRAAPRERGPWLVCTATINGQVKSAVHSSAVPYWAPATE